ncbi:glycosyltransferase [Mesonia maritima]|uniref:Glycosyltransferase involved in cell wall biosynthesis n=1 Tax=Mesonia maritima TaxID=1793873 RepID=A0ABU1K8N0_9FLAO|nr:glycosyltransferase family 2 protein [Mesonia maritima]MDR6301953.1 glycosyltransferase involved in cell wall biosynthesis [Mesonia maritima]
MRFYIVIPAHNEEKVIGKTLQSLVEQSHLPSKILVVNDNSSDKTAEVVSEFAKKYSFVSFINNNSSQEHLPGGKVILAFQEGVKQLDENYDVLCKFDADLIFPSNYLEKVASHFSADKKTGMAGGFCYIQSGDHWKLENLTDKDHIRGALKAYRKDCFKQIGGLKASMGWDTADELLAKFYGWNVRTDESLKVKHLRATGETYNSSSKYKQGEAFYKLRYGFLITLIASLKLALLKKKPVLVKDYLTGYFKAKKNKLPFLVNEKEGKWIRKYRWNKIKSKVF